MKIAIKKLRNLLILSTKNNWRDYLLFLEEHKENKGDIFNAYWFKNIPLEHIKFEALKMMEEENSHCSNFDDSKDIDSDLDYSRGYTTSSSVNISRALKSQELAHLKEMEQYKEKDKPQMKSLKEYVEQYEINIETEKEKYERKVNELNECEMKYQDKWNEVEDLNTKLEETTKDNQNLVDEMYSMINTFASIGNRFQLNNFSLPTLLTKLNLEK